MNKFRFHGQKRAALVLLATGILGVAVPAHADEREDLERLRATVLGLMESLVKNGVLPRAKVDAMMREAEAKAVARLEQLPPPELGADGKKVVRVQYVPESLKAQMREQIKAEVLAQTGGGRVMAVDASGEVQSRIRFEGDVRLRGEATRLSADNTAVKSYDSASQVTRSPEFLALGGPGKDLHTGNTQNDSSRERLRARIGMEADLTDIITASVALSTGSTSAPTSTNQTLGGNNFFNKSSIVLDRAAIRVKPLSWVTLNGGRFRNPFVGTDLLWADDLNFEGVSVTVKPPLSNTVGTFLTAGWFPLSQGVPNQSTSRSLLGMQTGVDWQFGLKENRFKLALGLYDFRNIEGIAETQATYLTRTDYVTRSEYGAGYRQRGNTLFRLNAPTSIDPATNWGLASGFRELDLTASLDVAQFDPMHVILTGDVVKNLKFKRDEIKARTGIAIADGKSLGYLFKAQVGNVVTNKFGAWNASISYRYLGSDAVLDAFTNSDFGLGGTNSKGVILGMNFGLAKNTWVSARWLSSNLIDPIVPMTTATVPQSKYATDVIQIDLNSRF
ncbi:putative porin [Actimicrobium sp. CCI2.3]|uniref:putative porin n=1 Tax=Actimicrobium sp. CCI2.3 TaxID=3048616 RepID=UPI002AB46494|nr:putative porin [Actimicrobium sp. CCI2.3]MDY7574754.1 putative porin [Actimicrobium sp. CCI2.3]MEB0020285.1 putative porin [Actimicrobium sp. CCI2.3]